METLKSHGVTKMDELLILDQVGHMEPSFDMTIKVAKHKFSINDFPNTKSRISTLY